MQRRQFWIREFLIEKGYERLPFVKTERAGEHPMSIAQNMWQILGFDEG